MIHLTIQKVCMICDKTQDNPNTPPSTIGMFLKRKKDICNVCKGILMAYIENIREKSPILKKSETTFNWD